MCLCQSVTSEVICGWVAALFVLETTAMSSSLKETEERMADDPMKSIEMWLCRGSQQVTLAVTELRRSVGLLKANRPNMSHIGSVNEQIKSLERMLREREDDWMDLLDEASDMGYLIPSEEEEEYGWKAFFTSVT